MIFFMNVSHINRHANVISSVDFSITNIFLQIISEKFEVHRGPYLKNTLRRNKAIDFHMYHVHVQVLKLGLLSFILFYSRYFILLESILFSRIFTYLEIVRDYLCLLILKLLLIISECQRVS